MRSFVVRIRLELKDTFFFQLIYNALNALSVNAHGACMPRNRFRLCGICDGAQDLPARTGQSKLCDKPITGKLQSTIQPKYIQYQRRYRFAGLCPLIFRHARFLLC